MPLVAPPALERPLCARAGVASNERASIAKHRFFVVFMEASLKPRVCNLISNISVLLLRVQVSFQPVTPCIKPSIVLYIYTTHDDVKPKSLPPRAGETCRRATAYKNSPSALSSSQNRAGLDLRKDVEASLPMPTLRRIRGCRGI